jgi:hypothetical protein
LASWRFNRFYSALLLLLTFNFALLTVLALPAVVIAPIAVSLRRKRTRIAVKRQKNPKTAAVGSRYH